jgi:hypothetical protein
MKQLGVLVLDFDEAYGTDPRFQRDAKVVVIANQSLSTEDVQQAIARGSRSMGPKEGHVFYVAQ